MNKIVITGANGFIGSALCKHFSNISFDVIQWIYGERFYVDHKSKVICLDMRDNRQIVEALLTFTPDIIIHCAGSADVAKSVCNPFEDFQGNVNVTHNLLFSVHTLKLDYIRFVFLSSAAVYGNPISLPIREDMPLNPLSPYAIHKVICEELCLYFNKNYGLNVKIGRIFSAYGTGLRKQIFWDMFQKYKNTGRLDMFGTGNESRDYIHIDDVVQSLYLLATSESNSLVYNIANGEEVTIRQAVELFADSIECNHNNISFNNIVREGDPLNWRADISEIEKLGYKKSVSMDNGLNLYVNWLKNS